MAGARVEIEVDDALINQALARGRDALDGGGVVLMLEDIGEHLLRSTRLRGDRQVSPKGKPWQQLSPKYKRYKDEKRPGVPKLKFDFHMLGDQLSHQVVGNTLFVGTAALYGATHQFGRTVHTPKGTYEIPARPWLGLSDDDDTEVLAIAERHVRDAFSA